MDFNLKQWRDESEEEEQESPRAKLQRLNNPHCYSSDPALPLFVPDPTTTTASPTKLISPRMGSYFSVGQWQELELQALIYRHMMAGAAVPPELIHLVNKTLISSPTPYYYQYPSLVQRGYWGKAAMDPEPGRCRRTDGKKWRCSRDVVVAHKYCERHMHRGKNRSRKPVEIPSTSPFSLSASTHHPPNPTPTPNPRPLNPMAAYQPQNNGQNGGDPTLRPFFDDWPRSLDQADNAPHSATNLSISTSDFSLKLGTSNGDECRGQGSRPQMNWGMAWETAHRPTQMGGGPLAEALRSSMSTSSPTSVLHRLQRSSASETSFVSS